MEINKRISLVLVIFFGTLNLLAAQDTVTEPAAPAAGTTALPDQSAETVSQAENLSYYIVETDNGIRFIQHIEWKPVQYVYRYEIIVEQIDQTNGKLYTEIVREFTEQNSIEISIPAGNYRYKIRVYNLLNKLDGESNWQEFDVFLAIQPDLESFSPRNYYLDDPIDGWITIFGNNFVENAEIFLLSKSSGGKSSAAAKRIVPLEKKFNPSGKEVEVRFREQDLATGDYDIVIQNPGGLDDSAGTLTIAFQKPVDLNISAGWTPMKFFNYKSSSDEYTPLIDESIDTKYFLTISARISFIPIKKSFGYFGIELSPFINSFSNEKSDGYTINGYVAGSHLNLLYQKPFIKKKLVGNVRIGAGVSTFYNLYIDYGNGLESDPLDTWFVSADVGLSLQYFITKQLFVDLGVDYQQNFANQLFSGFLRPGLFLGWQF